MIQFHFNPTAQSWQPTIKPTIKPTYYKAADLRFKRFLDDILTSNFIPTYYKAADLRFKRFLDDILASNYYYQSQMYNVHLLMTKHY